MKFKVKAKRMGYYNHMRIREDQEFMMDESAMMKKDLVKDEEKLAKLMFVKGTSGEYILPSWVELIDDDALVDEYIAKKAKAKMKEKIIDANKDVI